MKNILFIVNAVILLFTIPHTSSAQQIVELVQVKMNSRTINKGKFTSTTADIWYQNKDGKMISHYSEPFKMLMTTNNKGEVQLYNFERNTVGYQQNQAYSTQGSYFYYFLANRVSDLGLAEMGFKLADTKFEGSRVISKWLPPAAFLTALKSVELVLEEYKPIYMAYYDPTGKLIRKVFYYNYKALSNMLTIPLTVTEINYLDAGDSLLTKTNYSDIKINKEVTNFEYINFIIPANAKKMVD